MYDGEVIIGTKLDTKELEKDLKVAERQLQQYEKEAEKLSQTKLKAEADLQSYEEEKRLIKEITDESLKYSQTTDEVNNNLQIEKQQLTALEEKYSSQINKLNEINNQIKSNTRNQELTKNKVKELNDELSKKQGFNSIKEAINDIGKGMDKNIKKIGKWALAIFGIRSAYMFVRQAMSTLSQYDDQMAVNIEYIRYLLASTLKPVIEGIIQLAYKLLVYINYIAQAWFGVNLFANASTKAFEKQNKALGGSVKKAKQLQKTLAGFDEMNVLQDNGDVGSGKGGATLPNFPKMEDVPIPGWIQWLADNGDIVIGILSGITAGLIAMKLLGLDPIMSLGIGAIVGGIVMLVKDIIDFIKDPSWKKFVDILGDIAIIIGGIMLVMGNWWGLLVVIIGLVVKLIADNWDKIAEILGAIGGWIYEHIIKPVANFAVGLGETIINIVKNTWNFIVGVLSTVANWVYTKVIKPIANFFSGLWNGIKTGFQNIWSFITNAFSKGGKIFNGLKEGIVNVFKTIVNTLITGINKIIAVPFKKINSLLNAIRNVKIPVIKVKPFKGLWGADPLPIPKIPKLAKGGIINQPGRGVYTGSAIAGEAGREFYMPLQDEQMLSLVGEAIGKYVNINLTNITQLDGRQIARKVEQINNNNRFVLNR